MGDSRDPARWSQHFLTVKAASFTTALAVRTVGRRYLAGSGKGSLRWLSSGSHCHSLSVTSSDNPQGASSSCRDSLSGALSLVLHPLLLKIPVPPEHVSKWGCLYLLRDC